MTPATDRHDEPRSAEATTKAAAPKLDADESSTVGHQSTRDRAATPNDQRWGVSAVLIAATLYALTLCRELYWYDSAEFVAAAVGLGIPHPPGYPLYTLLAHVFTWLPVDAPLAVTLFSASSMVANVGLVWLLQRRLGASAQAAFTGAVIFATTGNAWFNATIPEVYGPGLLAMLGVLYLVLVGYQERRPLLFPIAALLAGMGLGLHFFGATVGLGYATLIGRWTVENRRDPKGYSQRQVALVWLGCALLPVVGSLVFLYLPWRAASAPDLNFGDPRTTTNFLWVVTGGNYKHWFTAPWYSWQWLSALLRNSFGGQMGFLEVVVGLGGLWVLFQEKRFLFWAWVLGGLGNCAFFLAYNVHDVRVFLLPAMTLLCIAVGPGVDAGNEAVREYLKRRSAAHGKEASADSASRWSRRMHWVTAALLVSTAIRATLAYPKRDLSEFTEADDFAKAVVAGLPANAILLNYTTPPEWKFHAVFVFYYQRVLRARPDVVIVEQPAPEWVRGWIAQGRSVYAYVPLPHLDGVVKMTPEGALQRLSLPEAVK